VPDPYRPLPPEGTGGEADPESTGTLFLMVFFLMLIAGFWGIMYVTLLGR
jgi:hypothetical protein